jgi:hypothetical protein
MSTIPPRRLEAYGFSWAELTAQQRDAVARVAEIMVDAVKDLDAQKTMSRRRSQLAFIDGDRGTGKTSVLLTVRALTTSLDPTAEHEDLPTVVQELVQLGRRFRWLETLDMEPVRRRINLFSAILARLEAESGTSQSFRSPIARALDELDVYETFQSKLGAIQNDAVFAWDRNPSPPSGALEPHAYAAEVLRAEKASLEINERLKELLDSQARLSANICCTKEHGPIFVLPVDDFDLAPTRCLELLRLIRAVTTPRLFFLICGSARLAETALVLQNEGELVGLVPGGVERDHEWLTMIRPTGIEVAANNLRKLIPPEQRAHLKPIKLAEALALKLDEQGATLRSSLSRLTFDVNSNPTSRQKMSMEEFLLLDGRWPKHAYFAADYLSGTPRQVHDIGMLLDRFSGHQSNFGLAFLGSLSEAIQRDISEDRRLLATERGQLQEATALTFSEHIRLRDRLSAALIFDVRDPCTISSPDEDSLHEASSSVRTSPGWFSGFAWTLTPYVQTDSREHRRPESRLAAGLALLHDVAMSLWGGCLSDGPLVPAPSRPWLAESPCNNQTWMATSWPLNRGFLHLPWPTPSWTTFRQVECFNSVWASFSPKCRGDELGFLWLESILRTVCDDPAAERPRTSNLKLVIDAIRTLAQEAPTREVRRILRRTTLAAIFELCMPEYQVFSDVDAQKLGEACMSTDEQRLPEDVAREVRAWRAGIWSSVKQSEILGATAFSVLAAVAPSAARKKWVAYKERMPRLSETELAAIEKAVSAKCWTKHPLSQHKWGLTPHISDLDDRDI